MILVRFRCKLCCLHERCPVRFNSLRNVCGYGWMTASRITAKAVPILGVRVGDPLSCKFLSFTDTSNLLTTCAKLRVIQSWIKVIVLMLRSHLLLYLEE